MIRLVLVELTRARWRRAVLLLLAGMVVLPAVIAIFAIFANGAPGDDGMEEAVRQSEEQIAFCLDDPEGYFGPGFPAEDAEQACRESNLPEYYLPYDQLDLARERTDNSGIASAIIVGLVALLVGTTFVGHDWATGSMSNQLLFEPRRVRVWVAKAVSVTVLSGVAAFVGLTLLWLVLALRFQVAGIDPPDGALLDGLQQGWRAAGVAALAALGGYALTMLSRSTVFTLGLLFGVSVAGGLLIGLAVDDRGPVDPTLNALAVINDGESYSISRDSDCSFEGAPGVRPCYEDKTRSLGGGVLYLGALTAVGCAASVVSYRRRDVP